MSVIMDVYASIEQRCHHWWQQLNANFVPVYDAGRDVATFHFYRLLSILVDSDNANDFLEQPQAAWFYSVLAVPASLFAIFLAIASHIYISQKEVHRFFGQWLYSEDERNTLDALSFQDINRRPWWQRYLLGGLGAPIGGLNTIATVIYIRGGQLLRQFMVCLRDSFNYIREFIMTDGASYQEPLAYSLSQTHWFKYFIMGAPGLIAGSTLGCLYGCIFIIPYILHSSWKGFIRLSGAFINVALERAWAPGFNEAPMTWLRNLYGIPGYLLAMSLTLPLSATFYGIKKAPYIMGVLLGIICLPLTMIKKGIELFMEATEDVVMSHNGIMSKFKRLLSGLSMTGNLIEGQHLQEGDICTSSMAYLLKMMAFDTDTPTERVIHTTMKAYKEAYAQQYQTMVENDHLDFFESEAFYNAVLWVKSYYQNGLLLSEEETETTQENIDRIASVVKAYMNTQTEFIVPTHIYADTFKPSIWALFNDNTQVQHEYEQFEFAQPSL